MKQKTGRKLLGILLTLALGLGLMPGMSSTVYAETYSGQVDASDLVAGDILEPGASINTLGLTVALQSGGSCIKNGETYQQNTGTIKIGGQDVIEISSEGVITVYSTSLYPYANGKVDKWEVTSVESDVITLVGYDGITKYPLWVGGTQVTSANADNIDGQSKASYDVTTNTLTLDNYIYEGAGYKFNNSYAGIYYRPNDYEQNLIINLKGTNSVTCRPPHEEEVSLTSINGIYFDNYSNLTIKGDGSLTTKIDGKDVYDTDEIYSISVKGNLVIEKGANVVASGCEESAYKNVGVYSLGGKITVNGTLEVKGEQNIGLCMDTSRGQMTVTGTLTASGADRAFSQNFNEPFRYTVPEGYTVTESGNVDGSNSTTVAVGSKTSETAKYVKIMPTPKDPVSYMAWNGTTLVEKTGDDACTDYTVVTSSTTTWEDGKWYVVKDNVSISPYGNNRITVSGTANLILCDGATLTAPLGITVADGNTLNIYAQSEGTGELYIKSSNGETNAAIGGLYNSSGVGGAGGTVNIHGGEITAQIIGGTGAGIGGGYGSTTGGSGGTVTIYGGTVTTAGGSSGAGIGGGNGLNSGGSGGMVTIYGGEVTAVGSSGAGIGGGAGGSSGGSGGTVAIYGGTVKTKAGGSLENSSVGIGGGYRSGGGRGTDGTLTLGTGMYLYGGTSANPETDLSNHVAPSHGDYARSQYMTVNNVAPHTHSFTYSASGATITATCTAANCPLADSKITMTIVKPTRTTYEGTGEVAASLDGMADFNSVTGHSVKVGDIKYKGRDGTSYDESATPPTGAGKYTAKITVEGKTASVDYEIAKAEPKAGDFTFTAPSELTYNGNQKSATVVPKDGITGMGDVTVKYYSDAACTDEVQRPTNAGTYYVGITVAEGTNYSETSSVLHDANWKFTITKAMPSKEDFNFSAPSDLTYDGSAKNATAAPKQGITGMGEVTVKYYSDEDCTTEVSPTNAGDYYVGITVAEGDNYSATTSVLNDESWKFTITKAAPKAGDFTYSAPTDPDYDGSAKTATVVASDGITGMGDVTVKYYSDAQCSTEVQNPTNVGTYYVGITVTEGDNYDATTSVLHDASWEFTINKGEPIATAPTASATYGQTLADVALTNPTGNTPGSWSWADSSASVGNVGDHTFKANFTPEDTANYNSKENVDVAVTVGKAANPATVNGTASVKKGGNELDLQGNVKLNGATGKVSYAISGETLGCTLSGSKLTSGNTEGSVTVNVTVAADNNYNASEPMPITVTITKKDTQTITAEDVTATYGDTGVKVAATTDGDGTITYAVKDGSGEYIGIMKDTGVLTLIKAGTGTVVVTASETSTYAQATKEVTVTINKAASNPAKVTANNRTYDGKKKDLLTVEGEASGGTMMYALGSETAPGAEYSEDIPAAADIGTYYVWYKVVGDENHEDTEPAYVTAKIEARQFTITYDLNGGKLDGETGKVTRTAKEGEVITLPAPTRDGYTFDYWEGSRYNAGDKYTVTEDHSFKAVWKTADSGKDGSGKSSGKKGAKTGDENTLAAWIVLLMAALTGTGGIVYAKKRRND